MNSGPTRANVQVIFVGAAWHSGSTILGLLLGAHDSIFYCGEGMCAHLLGDRHAPPYQRWCRLCGPDCPVWSGWPGHTEEYLYEYLSQRTGCSSVFDSSKSTSWARRRARELPDHVAAHLVLLSRDGRGVVNSHLRKHPDTPVAAHATAWAAKMARVEELGEAWDGPVHRVRYEQLMVDPEETLRRLCQGIGVEYGPAMCNPWNSDPHPLDGNPGPLLMLMRERTQAPIAGLLDVTEDTAARYISAPAALTLDLSWKDEMNSDALRTFNQVAGAMNVRYAWE
jgi:hypothetical protein